MNTDAHGLGFGVEADEVSDDAASGRPSSLERRVHPGPSVVPFPVNAVKIGIVIFSFRFASRFDRIFGFDVSGMGLPKVALSATSVLIPPFATPIPSLRLGKSGIPFVHGVMRLGNVAMPCVHGGMESADGPLLNR